MIYGTSVQNINEKYFMFWAPQKWLSDICVGIVAYVYIEYHGREDSYDSHVNGWYRS